MNYLIHQVFLNFASYYQRVKLFSRSMHYYFPLLLLSRTVCWICAILFSHPQFHICTCVYGGNGYIRVLCNMKSKRHAFKYNCFASCLILSIREYKSRFWIPSHISIQHAFSISPYDSSILYYGYIISKRVKQIIEFGINILLE